jgi:hypothetical protein
LIVSAVPGGPTAPAGAGEPVHRRLRERRVARLEFLAADVVFYGDGGGKGRGLPRPVHGQNRVSRLLRAFHPEYRQVGGRIELTQIDGQPGSLNLDADGRLISVFLSEIADGRIQAIRSIIDPERLADPRYPLSDVARQAAGR